MSLKTKIQNRLNNIPKRIQAYTISNIHKFSNFTLDRAVVYGKMLSRRRIKKGKLRSLWGTTPILTLPLLARCDKALGIKSRSLVFTTYVVTNNFDINLQKVQNWILKHCQSLYLPFLNFTLAWALLRYDIFHFFCDRGILIPDNRMGINKKELILLKKAGKFLFTYTYGADVRTKQITKNLGEYNLCMSCPAPGVHCMCDDEMAGVNVQNIKDNATAMLAMGDMLAYVPDAYNVHFWPLDLTKISYVGVQRLNNSVLRIAHVPNHTHFKGTQFLDNTVEKLIAEGYNIELLSAKSVSNEEVLRIYAKADIVADQFIAGFHGYAALEAMALGKPVLCYLRNAKMMINPATCPIINTNPDNLYYTLKQILDGHSDLETIGRESRKYVEANYSLAAISKRLAEVYLDFLPLSDKTKRMFEQRLLDLGNT